LRKCVVLYTEDTDLFEVCASNFNIVEELPDLWRFQGYQERRRSSSRRRAT